MYQYKNQGLHWHGSCNGISREYLGYYIYALRFMECNNTYSRVYQMRINKIDI